MLSSYFASYAKRRPSENGLYNIINWFVFINKERASFEISLPRHWYTHSGNIKNGVTQTRHTHRHYVPMYAGLRSHILCVLN